MLQLSLFRGAGTEPSDQKRPSRWLWMKRQISFYVTCWNTNEKRRRNAHRKRELTRFRRHDGDDVSPGKSCDRQKKSIFFFFYSIKTFICSKFCSTLRFFIHFDATMLAQLVHNFSFALIAFLQRKTISEPNVRLKIYLHINREAKISIIK